MKKALLLCLLLFPAVASFAQQIPITLGKNTQPPVVLEVPEEQKAILFFYSDRSGKAEICAVEVDAALKVLKTSETKAVNAPSGQDDLKLLGGFRPNRTGNIFQLFLKIGKSEIWKATLDRSTFALNISKVLDKPANTLTLGGLEESGHFYVLLRQKGDKKGGSLIVYETTDGENFTDHTVTSPKPFPMFEKKYDPIIPIKDVELDAETLSDNKDKIFSSPGKLYFVSDTYFEANGTDNYRTQLVTLDMNTWALDNSFISCFQEFQTDKNRVCSYVYDDKLFQLGLKNDFFTLQIINIADKNVLFSKTLLEHDSLNQVLNTEVMVPGRGSLGIERTYVTPNKFVRRLLQFKPYIQVRKSGSEYIIGMGGYEEVKSGPSPVMTPTGGFGAGGGMYFGTGGYNYERVTFFYSVISAADNTHSRKYIARTIQEQIRNLSESDPFWWNTLRAPGTFYFLGNTYFGEYSRSDDAYVFKKLTEVVR